VTLLQAMAYFLREALVSLGRSFRVSVLAVGTIAVSLFLGGLFFLVADHLSRWLARAQEDAKVVVYLEPGRAIDSLPELTAAAAAPWVRKAVPIGADEARRRFLEVYPSLGELVEKDAQALPESLELTIDARQAPADGFDAWLAKLRGIAGVSLVDDDRDWLRQLGAVAALVRGLGLVLGGVLLGAGIFTIASVIRLTAYLYQQEIAIQRLVGATEFYIRGPFYFEGLLQGLFGGVLAAGGLAVGFTVVRERARESLLTTLLAGDQIPWGWLLVLIAVGGAAGLVGAILSLQREALPHSPLEEAPVELEGQQGA
jgi:cell division transport system permease protein